MLVGGEGAAMIGWRLRAQERGGMTIGTPRGAPALRVGQILLASFLASVGLHQAAHPSPAIHRLPSDERLTYLSNRYRQISADGSTVRGTIPTRGRYLWTAEAGLEPTGANPIGSGGSYVMSPDGRWEFGKGLPPGPGTHPDDFEVFLWERETREYTRLGIPRGGSRDVGQAAFSPNGRLVAGNSDLNERFLDGSESFDVHAWVASADDGIRPLQDFPLLPNHKGTVERYGSSVVAITDAGVAYGNTRFSGRIGIGYATGFEEPDLGLRWVGDRPPEILQGTSPRGDAWTIRELIDVSDDGTKWLGRADLVRRDQQGQLVVDEVMGVFEHKLEPWILGSVESGYLGPVPTAISGDGRIVVGEVRGRRRIREPLRVWTREDGEVEFSVLLASVGLDVSPWRLEAFVDLSADGNTFLMRGPGRNHFGTEAEWDQYFVIVVPEPGSALLLGLGLIALGMDSRNNPRSAMRVPEINPARND